MHAFRTPLLLALAASAVASRASIVVFDPADITIPTGGQGAGVYFDLAKGLYTQDFTQPWVDADANIQLYRSTGSMTSLRMVLNAGGANPNQSVGAWMSSNVVGPVSLDPDALIGPGGEFPFSRTYGLGSAAFSAWRQERTGYLGLRFLNSTTQQTNYGWMEIVTTTESTPTYTATVTRWGFDDTGASILAGQTQVVPEPSALAALGLGGLALLRKRR